MKNVNITIVQRPVEIEFECPYCGEFVTIDYDDFIDDIGHEYPPKWYGSNVCCPECFSDLSIGDVSWS